MTAYLNALGVICALGRGQAQVSRKLFAGDCSGMRAESGWVPERVVPVAAEHGEHGELASLPPELAQQSSRNNQLLLEAALQIEDQIRQAIQIYGPARVGVVLGTSTSGIDEASRGIAHYLQNTQFPADYDYQQQELSAPANFLADWLDVSGPAYVISTACTSSARALMSAQRLLDLGVCDAVICGGVDSLCKLTLNGFTALEAVSAERCNPFSVNRNGINIGEAAVLFLMSREPAPIALLVQHAIGMQRFVTVFRTGDIRRGVQIAAILFLDDHAHRFAFLVFILIKENNRCSFTLYRQFFGFQIGHDTGQHWVVEAFTHHVVTGQRDVQTVIRELVLGHGDVNQFAPHLAEVLVTALEFYHIAACAFGEGFVFVIVLLRFAVKTFKVSQRHFASIFLLLFFEEGDQHAELRSPVTHVVSANDFMAQKFQRAHSGITDNGGTQVTHVHLFRHVGGRVVDHNRFGLRLSNAQTIGLQCRVNVACQESRLQKNVDKARACNLNFVSNAVEIQMSQHQLSELSRRHAQFFCNCHHAIGLIVAKLYFC